jgi:phage shock protein A
VEEKSMEIENGIAELYEHKMNAALYRDTVRSEQVEYSHTQLLDLLTELCRKAAEIALDRDHAAAQVSRLRQAAVRLHRQAMQAAKERQDGLALQALAWQAAILDGLPGLQDQEDALRAHEDMLLAAERGIRDKVEEFRIQRETIVEHFDRTDVRACIASAFAGIRSEIRDADIAFRRAKDDAENLETQVSVLNGPSLSNGNEDPPANGELKLQLDMSSWHAAAEKELVRIKEQLFHERSPG